MSDLKFEFKKVKIKTLDKHAKVAFKQVVPKSVEQDGNVFTIGVDAKGITVKGRLHGTIENAAELTQFAAGISGAMLHAIELRKLVSEAAGGVKKLVSLK